MEMEVEGLPATIAGGVHIHKGTSCDSTSTQLGHYWNPALDDFDPALGPKGNGDGWFNDQSLLAPTGTGHSTDEVEKERPFSSSTMVMALMKPRVRSSLFTARLHSLVATTLGLPAASS